MSRPYRTAIRLVDQLIDGGNSLSGSEPNCAFLNAGDGTFATASALTGFDFPDDARAIALVDWDGDGDLDAWITNRTAPMIRYLRNDTPGSNRSLLLRLEGTSASHDAAGARVEVRLKGQADKPIVRSVKLGEGYLGQSTRWLHFGLGNDPVIESVRITWPGGSTEEISGCQPDHTLRIRQGTKEHASTPLAARQSGTAPAPLPAKKAELAAAVTLFHPVLFPALPSEDASGKPWNITDAQGPVLINLFASWCPDCAAELALWRDRAGEFRKAGVSPILLIADGQDTAHKSTPADAWKWLTQNNIPFPAGVLTEEAFRRITTAHRQLFGAIVNLPIPTSLLLDGKGRLAAIYRGPVTLERILADTAAASGNDGTARAAAALPWPGNWLQTPDPPDPAFWVNDLAARKSWTEAANLFERHKSTLRPHRNFTLIAGALSEKLAAAGQYGAAIATASAAFEKSPGDPSILNNLANLLLTVPDKTLRDPARALSLAEKAASATSGKVPAILDTLAAAQAAAGDFAKAAATEATALDLARNAGDSALIPLLEKALRAYREGRLPD